MLNAVFSPKVRFWIGWILVFMLSGCFRSVPAEVFSGTTTPVKVSGTDVAEIRYFKKAIEEQVIQVILSGEESEGIRVRYAVEGQYTQKDKLELLALVEGIPGSQDLDAYWMVIQKQDTTWKIVGVSKPVPGGFFPEGADDTLTYWMPPQILDFDHDGIQEVFAPQHEERDGWKWDAVHVYRFDGEKWGKLDWSMIISQDNTSVLPADLALPFRYNYQVDWVLEDIDADGTDEILMDATVHYCGYNEASQRFDSQNVLGKQNQERIFKWAGGVFEPGSSDSSLENMGTIRSSVFFPWWDGGELPNMVFAEYPDGSLPNIHFAVRGENERVVPVENWKEGMSFQVLNRYVYFPGGIVEPDGVKEIPLPGLPGAVRVLASPDESELAWLFVSGLEGQGAQQDQGINATLLISDLDGDSSRVIWTMEQKDIPASYSLAGWSMDGRKIYLAQTYDLEAFPWGNSSGLLAVDSESGAVTRVGERVNILDMALSPDEAWLAQVEQLGQEEDFGLSLVFESRATGETLKVDSHENAARVGNFSFSPSGKWVIWQEQIGPEASGSVVIRGMSFEKGVPRDIREIHLDQRDGPCQVGVISGWVDEERFVLVEDSGKGRSCLVSFEDGKVNPLSPYSFLAVQE